jgi:hypothetical protein
MLDHRNDRAVTAELNDKLAKILVRKLTSQKRSLLRAIKEALFDLDRVPYNSLGEPDERVVDVINRLKKTVKKNSPKPSLFS